MTPRFTPAVLDYWSRLSARPAYQSALRAQERAAGEQGVATTPAPDAACRLPL
ncbi:MAG TPA: glutathione S-transferase, partial [Janthinobacterium sp.]|nr:glutathione S-transferase [Janthinobacterium sp.]